MSWIVAFEPRLTIKPIAEYGVPVKNYIDQSQEFALCAVALAYLKREISGSTEVFLAGNAVRVACIEFRSQHCICGCLADGSFHDALGY